MSGVYNVYLMFRISPMSDLPPLQLSFVQFLRLTREFEVTDKRDRVYGLLGTRTTNNSSEVACSWTRIIQFQSGSSGNGWRRKLSMNLEACLCFQACSMCIFGNS